MLLGLGSQTTVWKPALVLVSCIARRDLQFGYGLSGPTCTVALHSVALRFLGFGGVSQENHATLPPKGPCTALEGGVALQDLKLSLRRCRGTVAWPATVGRLGYGSNWARRAAHETSETKILRSKGPFL